MKRYQDIPQEVIDHEFDDEDKANVSHIIDATNKQLDTEGDGFVTVHPPL